MLFIVGLLTALIAVVSIPRMRMSGGVNSANLGWMSQQWVAIPLSAIALFAIALMAPAGATVLLIPATTVFVVAALGITAMTFWTSGAIPSLRPSRSLARVPPSGHRDQASEGIVIAGGICARTLEESNRSAADDALDLVRMDDDGGWQMARPPA
jgi:hypothetical protein